MIQRHIKKQIMTSSWIVICASCLSLLISFYLLNSLKDTQTKETTAYLSEIATQYKNAVGNQLLGDLQTLEGITVFLDDEIYDTELLINKLKEENNRNSFTRMGFIYMDGSGIILDTSDEIFEIEHAENETFIRDAMEGKRVISQVMDDQFSQQDIIGYAVPVQMDGTILGVLTATSTMEAFSEIISAPLFNEYGATYIIDSHGDIIIHNAANDIYQRNENIFDKMRLNNTQLEMIQKQFQENKTYAFSFENEEEERWATLIPIGIHDWMIAGIVPTQAIHQNFDDMIHLFYITVALLTGIFIGLFLYIHHILKTGRNSILHLAYFDDVTTTYNKVKFIEETNRLLHEETDYSLAVFDIRNFKFINEIFGYERGDALLRHIADVLRNHHEEDEVFYRDHSDIFGLLLHSDDPVYITQKVGIIMDEISAFQVSSHQTYPIICNCGIKVCNAYSTHIDVETLIDRAMMALHSNKGKHQNSYAFYDDALYEKAKRRNEIENHMETALQQGEFILYMQPKVKVNSGRICSAEALVRWKNQEMLLTPDEFIPLFENNGFITQLDFYVLEHACQILHDWKEKGYELIPISINQSRRIFFQDHYIQQLESLLTKYQIDPSYIILEITESIVMKYPETLEAIIKKVHALGISVSMDDFGSGYSSLNTLQLLSIDEIKLDRAFLQQSEYSAKSKVIMKNIVQLAHDLGIVTVGEGPETKEHAGFLKEIGCDIAQGYYYYRPMEIQAFEEIVFHQNSCKNK